MEIIQQQVIPGLNYFSNAIPLVDVTLTLDNVFPLIGSLHGGTPITFTGEGFGTNADEIEV